MASPFRFIAPPHTPFHSDGRLNLDVIPAQARLLGQSGVDGVFVSGTTGEVSSLTMEERKMLTASWCKAVEGTSLDVIVQVGDNCQANAVELARDAQQAGADAVATFAPSYFKPAQLEEMIDFLVPIAEAAADLPFYFYDIPGMTGVRLTVPALLARGKEVIPNLVGLKYSNTDLVQLQECIQLQQGEFEVLFGSDEVLLAAVTLGISGAVGSSYNFATPLYRRMLADFESGDMAAARQLQFRALKLFRVLEHFGYLAASKAVMAMLGVDCGPVRLPLRNLTGPQRAELEQQLRELGFFQPDFLCGEGPAPRCGCKSSQ